MKEKVILKVKDPFLKSYPAVANLFSVLEKNPKTEAWCMEKFIQIIAKKLEETDPICGTFADDLAILDCPFIPLKILEKECAKKDYLLFLRENLSEGYYILMNVNHFYLPCSDWYQKENYRHELLVYGYDLKRKVFYVGDYFVRNKYSFQVVKEQELEAARKGLTEIHSAFCDTRLYVFSYHDSEYVFHWDRMVSEVKNYIHASLEDGWKRFPDGKEIRTGILYYEGIRENILTGMINIPQLYVLEEQKKMMLQRIFFLDNIAKNYKNEKKEAENLYKETKLMMTLGLKYYLTQKEQDQRRLLFCIENLKEKDKKFMEKFLEKLEE